MELNVRIVSVTDTGTQRIVACETGGHFRVLRADGNTDLCLLSMLSEQKKEAAITVEGDMIRHVRPVTAVKKEEENGAVDYVPEGNVQPCLHTLRDAGELFCGFLKKRGGPESSCESVDFSEFFPEDFPDEDDTGFTVTSDTPFTEETFECPPFLMEAGDCGPARDLKELCRTDSVFRDTLNASVSGYPDGRGGITLVARDSAAYSCMAMAIGRAGIRNVTLRKTAVT